MSRFLIVVPPLAGHINPTVSVGQALRARGHDVAWVCFAGVEGLLPEGAAFYAAQSLVSQATRDEMRERSARWLPGLKVFWQEVVPLLAREMLPAVEEAIDDFGPDVLFADQHAFAGSLAARRRGVLWATSAATAAPISDGLEEFPAIRQMVADELATLEREFRLLPGREPDLSQHLVVLYLTEALVGRKRVFPPHYRFVGAAIDGRPQSVDFDWSEQRPGRRRVFVSLGTVSFYQGARFLSTLMEVVASMPIQAIVCAPPDMLPAWPENVIVKAWLPQVAVLSKVDAVVCHAGYSTQSEVLALGLPSVVAPIGYDSFLVAQMVADAGAGVRVRFNRCNESDLREALTAVLEDQSYAEAAGRIRESYRAAGGSDAAAEALEALAKRGRAS